MENKSYLVLTPEKIEDIFRDLERELFDSMSLPLRNALGYSDEQNLIKVLKLKKEELLKSIK
jgi:hypothetical protein